MHGVYVQSSFFIGFERHANIAELFRSSDELEVLKDTTHGHCHHVINMKKKYSNIITFTCFTVLLGFTEIRILVRLHLNVPIRLQ